MALLKVCGSKPNYGFTLIEAVIVMGLAAVVGSLGLFAAAESFRGNSFNNDRAAAVFSLARARGMAMNNMCFSAGCSGGKPHGVHFDPAKKETIIFQGGDFSGRDKAIDEIIKFDDSALIIGETAPVDVVFESLSGNSAARSVSLKDDAGHNAKILINDAGQIDWQ